MEAKERLERGGRKRGVEQRLGAKGRLASTWPRVSHLEITQPSSTGADPESPLNSAIAGTHCYLAVNLMVTTSPPPPPTPRILPSRSEIFLLTMGIWLAHATYSFTGRSRFSHTDPSTANMTSLPLMTSRFDLDVKIVSQMHPPPRPC